MKYSYYLLFSFTLFLCACGGNDTTLLPEDSTSLEDYIQHNTDMTLVRDSLIACALSSSQGYLSDPDHPISILYYPNGDVSDVGYFETSELIADTEDLQSYTYKSLTDVPLFNGYLRRFVRPAINENIWCRVTYVKDGNIFISNAIRIKYNDLPTEANNDLLRIDQSDPLSPAFSWEEGRTPENAIYFHVILDAAGDLVSGTYTFNRFFKFYDLSNVVLNIRDVTPVPSLQVGEDYQFVLMGVSLDNWVNLLINESFTAE